MKYIFYDYEEAIEIEKYGEVAGYEAMGSCYRRRLSVKGKDVNKTAGPTCVVSEKMKRTYERRLLDGGPCYEH